MRFFPYLFALGLLVTSANVSRGEKLFLVAGGEEETEPAVATQARLTQPFGIDFRSDGTMVVVEMTGEKIKAVTKDGMLSTIVGNGTKGNGGDGGPALKAQIFGAHNLIVANNDDIYIADTWNNRIRRIDAKTGTISAFAGTGKKGFAGDGGPAKEAEFGGVYCIAFDPAEKYLYVADLDNRRIRAIDMSTGVVTTVAGNGSAGIPQDSGPAIESPLVDPRAVTADDQGNIYILERKGNALRVVDGAGRIRTVVGKGVKDCVDESGKEPKPLKGPKHLCVDQQGNVIIADSDNHMIRKYFPREKKLVTLAGTGKPGVAGIDGPPREAQLNQPHGVYVHPSRELYIADSTNGRVLRVVE